MIFKQLPAAVLWDMDGTLIDSEPYWMRSEGAFALLKSAMKTEVVLFGEFHNNSISHWLQLELTKDIADKKAIVLGAEMLEADNQTQLNRYLKGEIDQK